VQRKKVETMGGEFEARDDKYTLSQSGNSRGAEIEITFIPRDPVDATKIGLTQAIRGYKNNAPYMANNSATLQDRTVPSGQEGEGWRTDRMKEKANPIYGIDDAPNLASSSTSSGNNARIGKHYRDGGNVLQHEPAWMYDGPSYNNAQTNSGTVFETTALAIEGAQAGTYYGSVQWGWTTSGSGDHKLVDFAVVSYGVPSTNFMAAANRWRTAKTSTGANPLALPTDTVPVSFVVAFSAKPGQAVCVVGSTPELGAWNSDHAVPMHFLDSGHWQAKVPLNSNQANKAIEYKYLLKDGGSTRWEEGANHQRTTGAVNTPNDFSDTWHETHMGK
jgi:hypothetical protein